MSLSGYCTLCKVINRFVRLKNSQKSMRKVVCTKCMLVPHNSTFRPLFIIKKKYDIGMRMMTRILHFTDIVPKHIHSPKLTNWHERPQGCEPPDWYEVRPGPGWHYGPYFPPAYVYCSHPNIDATK